MWPPTQFVLFVKSYKEKNKDKLLSVVALRLTCLLLGYYLPFLQCFKFLNNLRSSYLNIVSNKTFLLFPGIDAGFVLSQQQLNIHYREEQKQQNQMLYSIVYFIPVENQNCFLPDFSVYNSTKCSVFHWKNCFKIHQLEFPFV